MDGAQTTPGDSGDRPTAKRQFSDVPPVVGSLRGRLSRFFTLTPINKRRWENFKANRRGYWSLWLFLVLFILSLFAEVIANDRPILMRYKGEWLAPILVDYPEEKFGGFLPVTDYKDPFIQEEIAQNGWAIWPPIRYSYTTVNRDYPLIKSSTGRCLGFPAPPNWATDAEFCEAPPDQMARYQTLGNTNWLGTDDQGRDVVARLIYGFRISVLFGLILTVLASVIGVVAGAVQGYFGGWVDLIFQRILEIWSSVPALYVLIIISSVLVPGFWTLADRPADLPMDVARGRGARRVPARAQFRIHHGGARAWRVRHNDHVQAPVAERDGGNADVPAVPAFRLDYRADRARLPRPWPATRFAVARRVAATGQVRTFKRRGSACPRSSRLPSS
jgi:ABC-type dipeptide/oligopeptide/nickel transport system permease subunit